MPRPLRGAVVLIVGTIAAFPAAGLHASLLLDAPARVRASGQRVRTEERRLGAVNGAPPW